MIFNLVTPETTEDLLEQISLNEGKKFRFGAGYTDLLPELKKQPVFDLTVINLDRLKDDRFTTISEDEDQVRIGALVTASMLLRDEQIRLQYPALYQAADKLASRQIRNVATVGGNICTASPAGDIVCALVALEAECEILATDGSLRKVALVDFITGVRKTTLGSNEILRSVLIRPNLDGSRLQSGFIKVGIRRSMEIAVVSMAYHIQLDEKSEIVKAGAAIGSVAPTIPFVKSACEYLVGRDYSSFTSHESEEFARCVLEYASPISDLRASAWYRKEVLSNISKSLFENL